ncbi:MAG: hypothetical protein HY069_00040 [Chlamydiia bacterium]|nr:hypothetical protein [Chlamydiia bacterium]
MSAIQHTPPQSPTAATPPPASAEPFSLTKRMRQLWEQAYQRGAAQSAKDFCEWASQPVNYLGHKRLSLFSSSTPMPPNPYQSLQNLQKRIAEFDKIQHTFPIAPGLPLQPATKSSVNEQHAKQVAHTNAVMADLNTHLSNGGIVFALHWAINRLNDGDMENIFALTRQAFSKTNPPNIKRLVLDFYKGQLSLFRRICVHVIYFFCTFRGFIEKTVQTYLQTSLNELRLRFDQALHPDPERQGTLVPGLIKKGKELLKSYQSAFEDFAEEKPLIGLDGKPIANPTLDDYKTVAIEKLFQKSFQQLCSEAAATFMEQIAPTVEYKKGATWLNPLMNRFARWVLKRILPSTLEDGLKKGTEEIKPYKRPFVNALLKAIELGLKELKEVQDADSVSIPLTRFPGTEGLNHFVDQLFSVLPYTALEESTAQTEKPKPTPHDFLQVKRKLAQGSIIDGAFNEAFQEAIVNALNLGVYHWARPDIKEKMFSNLFELLSIPFTHAQNISQQDLDTLENKVLSFAKTLFVKEIDDAVKTKFEGRPMAQMKNEALRQFGVRKTGAQDFTTQLDELAKQLTKLSSEITRERLAEILRGMEGIKGALKQFSEEQQRLDKELAALTPPEKEAVLRPWLPIYARADAMMEDLFRIQKMLADHIQILDRQAHFNAIDATLKNFATSRQDSAHDVNKCLSSDPKTASIAQRIEITARLETSCHSLATIETTLQRQSQHHLQPEEQQQIQQFQQRMREIREKQMRFVALQKLDRELRYYLSRPGRRDIPDTIEEPLAALDKIDREGLIPLIQNLKPPANMKDALNFGNVLKELETGMLAVQGKLLADLRQSDEAASRLVPQLQLILGNRSLDEGREATRNTHNFSTTATALHKSVGTFKRLVDGSEKESQIQFTATHLYIGLGALGLVGGALAASLATGVAGSAILGAVAGTGMDIALRGIPLQQEEVPQQAKKEKSSLHDAAKKAVLERLVPVTTSGLIGGASTVACRYLGIPALVPTFVGIGTGALAARAFPIIGDGAQTLGRQHLKDLFASTYNMIRNPFLYQGAAKLALAQFMQSYRP